MIIPYLRQNVNYDVLFFLKKNRMEFNVIYVISCAFFFLKKEEKKKFTPRLKYI